MSVFVCLNCNKIIQEYSWDYITKHNDRRYCCDCNNEIFKVDDLFTDIIIKLNNKGYKTVFCCSGHYYDNNSYITFEDDYNFISLPPNYYYDSDTLSIRIRIQQSNSKYENLMEILKNAKQVEDWVDNLPILKNMT